MPWRFRVPRPPKQARERIGHLETRLSDVPGARPHAVGVENLVHSELWIDPLAIVEGVFELKLQPLEI
jgi:hypothetical protein